MSHPFTRESPFRARSPFGGKADIFRVGAFSPEMVAYFGGLDEFGFEEQFRKAAVAVVYGDLITFSRTGNATMVDSTGNLKWSAHNLLSRSEELDQSPWVDLIAGTGSATTVTANAGTAPDGSETADRLQVDRGAGTGSGDYSLRRQPFTAVVGVEYTTGIWVKSNTGANQDVLFYIATGASFEQDVVTVGSEWVLISPAALVATSTSAGVQIGSRGGSFGGDQTLDILVWGGRLYRSDLGGMVDIPSDERGLSTDTTYLPTTTAALYLARRSAYYFNSGVVTLGGVLLEPSRTNLLLHSSDFSNAEWTKDGATIDASVGTGPFGGTSASRVNVTAGAGDHHIFQDQSGFTSGDTVTNHIFVKADGGRYCSLTIFWAGNVFVSRVFDLQTQTKGQLSTGSTSGAEVASGIVDMGDDWYLIYLTGTSGAATGLVYLSFEGSDSLNPTIEAASGAPEYTAVEGEDYLIWNAQMEIGATPSSPIITTSSTAVRAADVMTIAAANLPYSAKMWIVMKLLLTYADNDLSRQTNGSSAGEATILRWLASSSDWLITGLQTSSARTGEPYAGQRDSGTTFDDAVGTNGTVYAPGINVPISMASRHGDTYIQVAADGVAGSENGTPTALPDLSGADLEICPDCSAFMQLVTVGTGDPAQAGLEAAS